MRNNSNPSTALPHNRSFSQKNEVQNHHDDILIVTGRASNQNNRLTRRSSPDIRHCWSHARFAHKCKLTITKFRYSETNYPSKINKCLDCVMTLPFNIRHNDDNSLTAVGIHKRTSESALLTRVFSTERRSCRSPSREKFARRVTSNGE